jgi:hypothetical protein
MCAATKYRSGTHRPKREAAENAHEIAPPAYLFRQTSVCKEQTESSETSRRPPEDTSVSQLRKRTRMIRSEFSESADANCTIRKGLPQGCAGRLRSLKRLLAPGLGHVSVSVRGIVAYAASRTWSIHLLSTVPEIVSASHRGASS